VRRTTVNVKTPKARLQEDPSDLPLGAMVSTSMFIWRLIRNSRSAQKSSPILIVSTVAMVVATGISQSEYYSALPITLLYVQCALGVVASSLA
jgi:hypothetical protein